MNPYESTRATTPSIEVKTSNSGLVPELACAISTAIANPVAAIAVIWRIDAIRQPSMSFWMLIAMFLALVSAIPLGFVATLSARGLSHLGLGLKTSMLMLAFSLPLTFWVTTQLASTNIQSLLTQYAAMVATIAIVPIAVGLTVHSAISLAYGRSISSRRANLQIDRGGREV